MMRQIDSLTHFCARLWFASASKQKKGTDQISVTAVHNVIGAVESAFPGALPIHRMAKASAKMLANRGHMSKKTLLATSISPDELNRQLEEEFSSIFGPAYNMGGLAGFCFGGVVGFGNMAHHVPNDGLCFVIYGPHVGVDWDAEFGSVNRDGHDASSECCGPAKMALEYCIRVKSGERAPISNPSDIIESQQTWVCKEVLPLTDRIMEAEDPNIELPLALYDAQDAMMSRIIAKAGPEMRTGTNIVLLGGITINTPEGTAEYFLPKKFAIVDNVGKVKVDLLDELLAAKAPLPKQYRNKWKPSLDVGHTN